MENEIRSVDNIFNITTTTSNSNVEGISTLYACVRLITQTIAATELKHIDKSQEVLNNTRLAKKLQEPQANQSLYNWLSNMTHDLILKGNSYAIILPNEILYVPESQVQIYITEQEENPYFYQISNYGKSFRLFPDNVLHFRNIAIDGIVGINPISFHASTFNASLSMAEYQSKFVDNAAQISGVITTEKKLNKETIEQLRSNFSNKFSGANNAGKVPVLSEGMKFNQLDRISPLDMDFINSAKLNKTQIAEIFNVPLSFLGSEMTYNNSEVEALRFINYTLAPIYKTIEQEMTLKLISDNTRLNFIVDSIKSASTKEKAESLSLLVNTGIITPNESRKHYGLTSLQGGDELKSEANKIGEAVQAPKNTEDTNVPANKDKKEQE